MKTDPDLSPEKPGTRHKGIFWYLYSKFRNEKWGQTSISLYNKKRYKKFVKSKKFIRSSFQGVLKTDPDLSPEKPGTRHKGIFWYLYSKFRNEKWGQTSVSLYNKTNYNEDPNGLTNSRWGYVLFCKSKVSFPGNLRYAMIPVGPEQ
ncbi:hypothetical protein FACS1894172_01830 [Spirochaetia bacterium]|nr:hypothetical protein FACS1894172_01830 [Spirochaetia bacterium]